MSYDHQEIGDFANEKDAQDWAERNTSMSATSTTAVAAVGVLP